MSQQRRIDTISLLIQSNNSFSPNQIAIEQDLKVVPSLTSMKPLKRRNLIQIFFSSRAIDTSLKTFLDRHGLRGSTEYSIGKYLDKLHSHNRTQLGNLSRSERDQYKRSIANVRNGYLHQANTYPNGNQDVNLLLSEIETLLSVMVTL
ncbi:hypothetical protein [Gramella sp. KN1008]|uniref:hypothetical protein n=1 Tax=Gramella sp. KN1008 TaxID=2529298 RepID=UPI00103F61F4|nr:hypothetical protein [Gramella sp. KN1008]TBW25634.1 hypothetical protein EZJ28_15655 [Gramella sp. KN1008]